MLGSFASPVLTQRTGTHRLHRLGASERATTQSEDRLSERARASTDMSAADASAAAAPAAAVAAEGDVVAEQPQGTPEEAAAVLFESEWNVYVWSVLGVLCCRLVCCVCGRRY